MSSIKNLSSCLFALSGAAIRPQPISNWRSAAATQVTFQPRRALQGAPGEWFDVSFIPTQDYFTVLPFTRMDNISSRMKQMHSLFNVLQISCFSWVEACIFKTVNLLLTGPPRCFACGSHAWWWASHGQHQPALGEVLGWTAAEGYGSPGWNIAVSSLAFNNL